MWYKRKQSLLRLLGESEKSAHHHEKADSSTPIDESDSHQPKKNGTQRRKLDIASIVSSLGDEYSISTANTTLTDGSMGGLLNSSLVSQSSANSSRVVRSTLSTPSAPTTIASNKALSTFRRQRNLQVLVPTSSQHRSNEVSQQASPSLINLSPEFVTMGNMSQSSKLTLLSDVSNQQSEYETDEESDDTDDASTAISDEDYLHLKEWVLGDGNSQYPNISTNDTKEEQQPQPRRKNFLKPKEYRCSLYYDQDFSSSDNTSFKFSDSDSDSDSDIYEDPNESMRSTPDAFEGDSKSSFDLSNANNENDADKGTVVFSVDEKEMSSTERVNDAEKQPSAQEQESQQPDAEQSSLVPNHSSSISHSELLEVFNDMPYTAQDISEIIIDRQFEEIKHQMRARGLVTSLSFLEISRGVVASKVIDAIISTT